MSILLFQGVDQVATWKAAVSDWAIHSPLITGFTVRSDSTNLSVILEGAHSSASMTFAITSLRRQRDPIGYLKSCFVKMTSMF